MRMFTKYLGILVQQALMRAQISISSKIPRRLILRPHFEKQRAKGLPDSYIPRAERCTSGFIFFGRIYTFEFVILSSEPLPRSRSCFMGM